MTISRYSVGEIPSRPLSITVRGSYNTPWNASDYTEIDVELLDPRNGLVDTSGGVLQTAGAPQGRFVYEWPKDKSLFDIPGEYLLRLVLKREGYKDMTSDHAIYVRRFGGVK